MNALYPNHFYLSIVHIHGLVQDFNISSALAMEILQSLAKLSISFHTANIELSALYPFHFYFSTVYIYGSAQDCSHSTPVC